MHVCMYACMHAPERHWTVTVRQQDSYQWQGHSNNRTPWQLWPSQPLFPTRGPEDMFIVYWYICKSMCIYICVHVYVYMCTCIRVYVYVCIYVRMYACKHVCMYTCIHVRMCACMHVYMYTCIHFTHQGGRKSTNVISLEYGRENSNCVPYRVASCGVARHDIVEIANRWADAAGRWLRYTTQHKN